MTPENVGYRITSLNRILEEKLTAVFGYKQVQIRDDTYVVIDMETTCKAMFEVPSEGLRDLLPEAEAILHLIYSFDLGVSYGTKRATGFTDAWWAMYVDQLAAIACFALVVEATKSTCAAAQRIFEAYTHEEVLVERARLAKTREDMIRTLYGLRQQSRDQLEPKPKEERSRLVSGNVRIRKAHALS